MRVLPCLLLFTTSGAAEFRAGVAKVNLEPPPAMAMSGYASRSGVSKGVLDPLQARVLAISDSRRTLALVTLDLIFPFELPEMERIRAAVRGKVDEVVFHASHTHSGPTYSTNRAAYDDAVARVERAVLAAASALVPARLGSGWGVAYLGHNRRHILSDGEARMMWRNDTRVSTFPVDPTVGVIRIDRVDGSPLAVLINYACHPVVFGPDNLDYSADYPGEMRNVVERDLGGMALFLQGAPGDINPDTDKTPIIENAVARMKDSGRILGDEAARIARRIHTEVPAKPLLASKTVILPAVSRWDVPKLRAALKERYRLDEARAARLVREKMDLPVTTMVWNGEIAFVTMPGEPFVEFQMQLRAGSPVRDTFFLGYTNGSFGYFPTIAAAVRGGYGANSTSTMVEVGAGERMLNIGLVSIYELLGRL